MTNDKIRLILGFVIIPLTLWSYLVKSTLAQPTTSVCQPPRQDEYLLFILTQTRATHREIQATLPPELPITFCQYLDDRVTRVGGFNNLLDVQGWARYFNQIAGLSAFVIQAAPSRNSPTNNPSLPVPVYQPQPLADGYAVLVDYFNQPEIASELRQIIGTEVGLVSYAQRPYLLALYTKSKREANSKLRQLSDRGFRSIVVDSRSVIVIRDSVIF